MSDVKVLTFGQYLVLIIRFYEHKISGYFVLKSHQDFSLLCYHLYFLIT